MRLPEEIPRKLRHAARVLPVLADGQGAWPREQALQVIDSLESTTVAISDVTPHRPLDGDWIPSSFSWSLHRKHHEADIDYARRSRQEAAEFIQADTSPSGMVLFVLTFPMFKDAA